ncbi:MAG: HD domain-containing protein [Oliverpabstia sp.]|nr:HD domain-containing protein [Oliverpabstia sp.]
MRIKMPAAVNMIIEVLQQRGYEAFAVGGCVRDSILGRIPDDWDITTSASPYQVKELFQRTVDTGLQHGTVTVMVGNTGYEVTTYRIDGEYEDGRHPKEVLFTSNLTEDLKRRDFTINAMAYSQEQGLIDAFGGMDDMQNKIIRCVGDPWKRFGEDALRILRAVRFAAQLGFVIEEKTKQAIVELAPTLVKISAERIQTEMVKLLISDRPQLWKTVYETGITKIIMPEFDRMMETEQNNPHHIGTVGEHTLLALTKVEKNKVLRLTMLLHDLGKYETRTTDEQGTDHFYGHGKAGEELAKKILRRLKFDNDTIRQVTKLVLWHDYRVTPERKAVRRAVNKVGEDLFPLLLKIQRADYQAQSEYRREEKMQRLSQVEEIYNEILENKECVSLKTLAVTGRDLIHEGMKPGPQLGATLQQLLEAVLEQPEMNEKEKLLEYWKIINNPIL